MEFSEGEGSTFTGMTYLIIAIMDIFLHVFSSTNTGGHWRWGR
jgi:hypothetical protein